MGAVIGRYNTRMFTRRLLALFTCGVLALSLASAQDDKPKREPAKPQSTLASKTVTFATLKADDPALGKALKASDLAGAKKIIGKEGSFEGTVVKVFSPKSNGIVILNFDKNFRNALTAVLRTKSYAAFPDMQSLKGKRVLITGKFEDYEGQPQISLTKPDQVKLIP